MSISLAVIVGGGGLVLLVIVIVVVWYFMVYRRKLSNTNSETSSSEPSVLRTEQREREGVLSSIEPPPNGNGVWKFTMEELEKATNNFNENNLIGSGSFGLVYKGLLSDGTFVAIKKRSGPPKEEFVQEVTFLSRIRHRNLVSLFGYCQEKGFQTLVFENLPNGSICNHLYELAKESTIKLEFRQRLTVAIGAAKGLSYLHSQDPPVLHGNLKTANVLVDENFIAKVSDAGLRKLLEMIEDASSSHSNSFDVFRPPERGLVNDFTKTSDVFGFGVFLLELVSGNKAGFGSNETILEWMEKRLNSNDLVDHRLVGSYTVEGLRDLLKLIIKCIKLLGRERPKMEGVVLELEYILEKEIMRTIVTGESTTTVTLGSKLFTK